MSNLVTEALDLIICFVITIPLKGGLMVVMVAVVVILSSEVMSSYGHYFH